MDVTLYVYDLSRGMARQMSMAFLGTHIDAVYHTALVFGNIEYFFGAGVQTCLPGTTHHGQPMQKIPLGQTQLPLDVILEYLESLKSVYTAESYDLFLHNCNNFSNDFAMFLVGKGIPDHITSLPQTVLNTPFGQMLKPQLDQALRGVTQAPVAPPPRTSLPMNAPRKMSSVIQTPITMAMLTPLLEKALSSCAVLFFTSPTCPPCKICYEPFELLAEEFAGKVTLIKIDISQARDIAAAYSIRATPTFISILRGETLETWSGADVSKLQGNTRLLVQMAHPPHPHSELRVPSLQKEYKPHVYSKIPPLDKLLAKMDSGVRNQSEVEALRSFVIARASETKMANIGVPDLKHISQLLCNQIAEQQPLKVFPLIDLLRLSLLDPRVSGYFAEEPLSTSAVNKLVSRGANLKVDAESYPFLLTAIQASSNMFTSKLSETFLLGISTLDTLIQTAILTPSHPALRAAGANLIFNLAASHHRHILEVQQGQLQEATLIELIIGIVEALDQELKRDTNAEKETIKALTLSFGLFIYGAPRLLLEELSDLLSAVEAKMTITKAGAVEGLADIVKDVVQIMP